MISAEEAAAMGLVARIFSDDELWDETLGQAKQIAQKGAVSLRAVKHVIDNGFDVDLKNGCALEVDAFSVCFASEDHKEGTRAFLEKRAPAFNGKLI
jgi:enoyl-CoA hydratase